MERFRKADGKKERWCYYWQRWRPTPEWKLINRRIKIRNWKKRPGTSPASELPSAFRSSSPFNTSSPSQETGLDRGDASQDWNCFRWLDKCCDSNSDYGSFNEKIDSRIWQKLVWQSSNSSPVLAWNSATFAAPSVYHIFPGEFHAHKERQETTAYAGGSIHTGNSGRHLRVMIETLIFICNWIHSCNDYLLNT